MSLGNKAKERVEDVGDEGNGVVDCLDVDDVGEESRDEIGEGFGRELLLYGVEQGTVPIMKVLVQDEDEEKASYERRGLRRRQEGSAPSYPTSRWSTYTNDKAVGR